MFYKSLLKIFFLIMFAQSVLLCNSVLVIKVEGAINQSTSDFIERGIEQAINQNAECLIIQLNTPGGLLKSTRVIVQSILTSKIPIVVYVSPGGAHAGSAGVFITMSAHIAAMANGTNIGAAHPVDMQGQMDSVMSTKVTNDAAAFIRSIAEKRNRNLKWAEDAVVKSLSITENEALKNNIIDYIAPNIDSLLQLINNKKIETSNGYKILNSANAKITTLEMSWAEKLLSILSDPNIALILFQLGLFGLMFELYNPGSIFPGVIGVISLLLALYSMHTLPINYAGLALIVFAIILFLLEIKIVSHGLLGIGGAVSMFLGSIMLIKTSSMLEIVNISLSVVIISVALTTFFFMFLLALGIKAQKRKPETGEDGMIGKKGEVIEPLNPLGTINIHGEIWKAESVSGTCNVGDLVIVKKIDGLKLLVEKI